MATANLRLSFGAMYIGCVIAVSFSGIAALQAYLYYRTYRHRDSRRLKLTVLAAWLLDLVHTIFICQGIWHYLVLNWGNTSELDHLTWTVALSIAITGFLTIVVHGFFANRVWQLSKHNGPLTILICALAVIRLGSALTTTAQMLRLKHFTTFITDFRWLFTLGLALSSIIDIVITGALCYYLQGSRTGYSSIDDVIHRLLLYTVNNGLLTSFASVLSMVCAAAMPHNFLFLSLHFIVAKCYINSLLATLNSRDTLRDRDDAHPMAVQISVDGPNAKPRFFRRQLSHGHSASSSKDLSRSGSAAGMTGIASIGLGHTATLENVKVRPKRDTFSSSITVGPSEYSNDEKLFPPMSPTPTFTTFTIDSDQKHCYPPSPPSSPPLSPPPPFTPTPAQVHINVEQTIHRDDGEIETDLGFRKSLSRKDSQDDYSESDTEKDKKDPENLA